MESQRKRSSLEIFGDILKVMRREEKPTRIMYATNLSWKPLMKRLNALIALDMVSNTTNSKGHKRFHLTEKGKEWLREYRGLISRTDESLIEMTG